MSTPMETEFDLGLKVVVHERQHMVYLDAKVFTVVIEINRREVFQRMYTNLKHWNAPDYAIDADTAKQYAVTAFADKLQEVLL